MWQPIETAPKDGTVVDLWSPQCGRYPDAVWGFIPAYEGPDEMGWTDKNHHGSLEDAGPWTHWMPPPNPPKPSENVGTHKNHVGTQEK